MTAWYHLRTLWNVIFSIIFSCEIDRWRQNWTEWRSLLWNIYHFEFSRSVFFLAQLPHERSHRIVNKDITICIIFSFYFKMFPFVPKTHLWVAYCFLSIEYCLFCCNYLGYIGFILCKKKMFIFSRQMQWITIRWWSTNKRSLYGIYTSV